MGNVHLKKFTCVQAADIFEDSRMPKSFLLGAASWERLDILSRKYPLKYADNSGTL